MSHQGWPLTRMVLDDLALRFDFRRARVCRPCRGRGKRRRVLWWRGWKQCHACYGQGMLGG